MQPRRPLKGMAAAYASKDPVRAQQELNDFIAERNEYRPQDAPVINPHFPPGSPTATPLGRLNAAMLLDPRRGMAKQHHKSSASESQQSNRSQSQQQSAPAFTFTSPNDPVEIGDDHMPHQGSLIERMHNLEERVDNPHKRIKRSASPSSSETSKGSHRGGFGRRGGGGVAQHIKDHRARLAEEQGTTATMMDVSPKQPGAIDLTSSDDPIQGLGKDTENIDLTEEAAEGEQPFYMVGGRKVYYDANDQEEKEVCYGRLEGARISAFLVPNPKKQISSKPEWPPMAIELVHEMGNIRIKAMDPAGKCFGNLDSKTAYALKNFFGSPIYRLRLDARLDARSKEPYEAPDQPISKTMSVTINAYGPRKYAKPIGKDLSQKQIWLRQPRWLPSGMEVFNPHCVDPQQARQAKKAGILLAGAVSGSGHRARTAEQEQMEITSLFENLQKVTDLPMVEPDNDVLTTLLEHQKQGLAWMLKREDPKKFDNDQGGSMWRREIGPDGSVTYGNIITGHHIDTQPRETQGGLLADMMGLGKTLQLLSLLSYTKGQASEFEQTARGSHSADGVALTNVKTTLLVCPMSVISNWEDQILSHLREQSMSYYIFHGSNRNKDPNFLAKFDIVLTTYPTVKSEFFPSSRAVQAVDHSPLSRLNFFRVVLDEAHAIRTQTTQQYRASLKLNAPRRWCLTATPIQNRLDDFGSLVTFLRVSPFDTPGIFAQAILTPFKIGDPEAVKRLRILVDTITLRRLKNKIDLQPRRDVTVRLQFSSNEQAIYNCFAQDANSRVNAITEGAEASNKKVSGKGYINILRSILCLRQISAHGKELLRDEDLKLIEGKNAGTAIDVDEEENRPALTATQAYGTFDILRDSGQCNCASCGHPINANTNVRDSDEEDPVIATMLPCYQLVCNPCVKAVHKKAKAARDKKESLMACPFCMTPWRICLFEITLGGIAKAEQLKEDLRNEPRKAKVIARYDGPHTKTTALLGSLVEAQSETKTLQARDPKAKPIKSVVFSYWTTHLDLISLALDEHRINYTSLTGSMSRKQRKDALRTFADDDDINVFLVSIGTGGVGLNLTAASRVYLMDIGFNPMAEQQAIDRVHRLGQTRDVTFTRYLMAGSIEEKILELQKKKEDLADLSLKKGAIDRTEAARQRLEDLKELFR